MGGSKHLAVEYLPLNDPEGNLFEVLFVAACIAQLKAGVTLDFTVQWKLGVVV